MYLFGGINENSVERFKLDILSNNTLDDIKAENWNVALENTSMGAIIGSRAILVHEKIYIIGGAIGNNYSMTPINQTFILQDKPLKLSKGMELPYPVSFPNVELFGNRIIIFGGYMDKDSEHITQQYIYSDEILINVPTLMPTTTPTSLPSLTPTNTPTANITISPSNTPTLFPTASPTTSPSINIYPNASTTKSLLQEIPNSSPATNAKSITKQLKTLIILCSLLSFMVISCVIIGIVFLCRQHKKDQYQVNQIKSLSTKISELQSASVKSPKSDTINGEGIAQPNNETEREGIETKPYKLNAMSEVSFYVD